MLISSDTNIWIDFFEINHPDHPFLLDYKYYLSSAAYDDELIPSDERRTVLKKYGLLITDLKDDEMRQAMEYANKEDFPSMTALRWQLPNAVHGS